MEGGRSDTFGDFVALVGCDGVGLVSRLGTLECSGERSWLCCVGVVKWAVVEAKDKVELVSW